MNRQAYLAATVPRRPPNAPQNTIQRVRLPDAVHNAIGRARIAVGWTQQGDIDTVAKMAFINYQILGQMTKRQLAHFHASAALVDYYLQYGISLQSPTQRHSSRQPLEPPTDGEVRDILLQAFTLLNPNDPEGLENRDALSTALTTLGLEDQLQPVLQDRSLTNRSR